MWAVYSPPNQSFHQMIWRGVHATPEPIFPPFRPIKLCIDLFLTAEVSSIDGDDRRLKHSSGGNIGTTAIHVDGVNGRVAVQRRP